MNIRIGIKSDKTNKEVTKTIKMNVKDDKMNKTVNNKKNEMPRPNLKSIGKRKTKPETAKPLDVDKFRKLTEFWLPSPDREKKKTSNFKTPAPEPAKQDFKQNITLQARPDVRMGGGGGGKLMSEDSNSGKTHSTYQGGYKADCSWPDVKKTHRLSQ